MTDLVEEVRSWESVAWRVSVAQAVLALGKTVEAAGSGSLHMLLDYIPAAEELRAAGAALGDCQAMAHSHQTFVHLGYNR